MGRKKVLEKRLARLQAKKETLTQRAMESQDANEVRSINEQLSDINDEIAETREEIDAIELEERGGDPTSNTLERSNVPPTASHVNANIPIASYTQTNVPNTQRDNLDPYASLEYRTAFKDYIQRGTPIPSDLIQRAGGDEGVTVTSDIGVIVPTTVMNEFIKGVSKVYGQLYTKVRKLNIKGGVKFPISDLKANFKWITETTVSKTQKAGDINTYVEFSYNIGEIRVAQTLLSQVVALTVFEDEITKIMIEAYVEAMDKGIISGTGSGQMLGILNDTRVTGQTGHIIEMTETQFSTWSDWRKKLFAAIPISKRGKGEFIFTAGTVESNLLTMKDNNNRPIFKEAAELAMDESGAYGRFYGRPVTLVEPDVIGDFDTAESGDVVGIYWNPTDYAINTNLAFGIKRYFDDDKNEWVNKGLTIVDGKVLDPTGIYIIKKK